ncbi:MAG: fumarylacetoacetate hydrolase family protein [Pseudomonadota bacterium]
MRLITFTTDQSHRVGAVDGDRVFDLTSRIRAPGMRWMFQGDMLSKAEQAMTGDADFKLADVTLALPVIQPPKIICVGVNYMNRNEEYKDGQEAPKNPSLFMRTPLSFSPHDAPIYIPPESEQFDYEGEIVLVIGKPGRRIPQETAHQHIGGLTIMNEGSVRDWLRHAKFNVTQGKNFDKSGGLGPWIETDPQVDLTDMTVTTRVNGEERQHDTTANMAFPFARIIEYISTFTSLQIGDIIATGTPTGAGARFDPPKWLVPGDVVEVEVQGVGTLRNPVDAEPSQP